MILPPNHPELLSGNEDRSHGFTEMRDQLSSMKKVGISDYFLMKVIGDAVVFVMRVK